MKYISFFTAWFLCGGLLFAETPAPAIDWKLLWSGSLEEISPEKNGEPAKNDGTVHNRGELKLNLLPYGLMLRGEVLARQTLNFQLDPLWLDPDRKIIKADAKVPATAIL